MSSKESRRRSNRRSNRKQKYSTTTSSVMTDDESNGSSSSDDDQHYKYRKGEYIKEYKVKRHIFDGTFGRVLKVKRRNSKTYALKIVRRNHVESAQSEADVLYHLKKKGLSRSFVELYECFHHKGYYCMVFERLGPSLYELMKFYKNHGIPMTLIKIISKQLLKYIGQLHDLKIVHTDLKPENILFSKNYKFKKGYNKVINELQIIIQNYLNELLQTVKRFVFKLINSLFQIQIQYIYQIDYTYHKMTESRSQTSVEQYLIMKDMIVLLIHVNIELLRYSCNVLNGIIKVMFGELHVSLLKCIQDTYYFKQERMSMNIWLWLKKLLIKTFLIGWPAMSKDL